MSEGAVRGGDIVRREFASVLTRKRFCESLGIHPTTLRRWEAFGVVAPQVVEILGIRTMVFSEDDLRVGREIVRLLAAHPGTLSLRDAATQARRGD